MTVSYAVYTVESLGIWTVNTIDFEVDLSLSVLWLVGTHTHTHVDFYGLRGLSIGVMVFILYKLYVLLPYT